MRSGFGRVSSQSGVAVKRAITVDDDGLLAGARRMSEAGCLIYDGRRLSAEMGVYIYSIVCRFVSSFVDSVSSANSKTRQIGHGFPGLSVLKEALYRVGIGNIFGRIPAWRSIARVFTDHACF